MKFGHWICCSLLGVVLMAAAPVQPDDEDVKEPPVTELGQWMDRMNNAFRKLRRQADEPAHNATSIELVITMQEAANNALDLIPAKTEDLPEDERAKFVESYRTELNRLIGLLKDIETAFRANDNAEALQLMSAIRAARKQGHKEFQKDPA